MVVVELGKPASSPTLILSYFGKLKLLVGLDIRDVSIDNDDAPTHLRHQVDELARLIQVVKEATAEDHIEDTVLRQVVDIVICESQVGQIGSRFDSLTIVKIILPNLDASASKPARASSTV